MAIYKNKDLEVDISLGTSSQNGKSASFYSGDKNSTSIRITVKHKGNPFNFTTSNLVPTLDLFHSDGSIWLSEPMNIVVGESGVVSYNIPNNIIEHVGTINAKLFLKNDTTSVHAMNFNFEILDSGIEGEVEKEVSLVLVEDTVRNIMTENALGLIDETFKTEVLNDFQAYTIANPELFKGEKGDTGEQGVRGPIGLTGAQGLTGAKGDKGDKGDTGDRGPQGVQGPKGDKGEQGIQGIPGVDGVDGANGVDGADGENLNAAFIGAMVKLNNNIPLENNTVISIPWEGTHYNTSGFWSSSNPTRLTVPEGVTKVKLSANVLWQPNSTGTRLLRMRKNGQYTAGLFYEIKLGASTSGHSGSSAVVEVSAGDYFELEVNQVSGATLDLRQDPYTWFSIEVVELAPGVTNFFSLVGHRGASGYEDEHTIEAYDLAIAQGVDYIELDLQLTSDGELICMHDSTVDRTTNGTGTVASKTLTQIKELRTTNGKVIPTLEEVVAKYGKTVNYYIETKRPFDVNMDAELLRVLQNAGLIGIGSKRKQVIIQSFADESLINIGNQYSDIFLVRLSSTFTQADIDTSALIADGIGPKYTNVTKALVDNAHSRGLVVHPWTVNTKAEMDTMVSYGVDGLFTNYPDLFIR